VDDRPGLHGFEGRTGDLLELLEVFVVQPALGAPVMNHGEPLSATISPKRLSASGSPEMPVKAGGL
jgi:hypothetical protein